MATLAVTPLHAPGGQVLPFVAASAGGDRVAPGSRHVLLVRNASAASINVTLDTTGLVFNGQPVPDTVVAVAAGATVAIPVTDEYKSDSDKLAGIAYSAVATVTVCVIRY